ncbi:MAG: hypothetical protein JSR78_16720 [Proteobacteria bacterium]|nr:hypothetical protein [Pseudomonadota bacterium]
MSEFDENTPYEENTEEGHDYFCLHGRRDNEDTALVLYNGFEVFYLKVPDPVEFQISLVRPYGRSEREEGMMFFHFTAPFVPTHREAIEREAGKHGLDPEWLLQICREVPPYTLSEEPDDYWHAVGQPENIKI